MKLRLHEEVLGERKHVHSELVVFVVIDVGSDDHEDGFPVVDDGGVGSADEHVEDEPVRGVFVPSFVILLHFIKKGRELN